MRAAIHVMSSLRFLERLVKKLILSLETFDGKWKRKQHYTLTLLVGGGKWVKRKREDKVKEGIKKKKRKRES